eukprot:TRINITY_DN12924_c0_g2_i3.p1 TRINITY_DN12924_c0_g2~~TRINITY_DN12924_c0_g2_i3.p1  ORF type:complete len:529 (+),score=148.88 TRINITY_DN12924_c0_g2_i3:1380-2966(+)
MLGQLSRLVRVARVARVAPSLIPLRRGFATSPMPFRPGYGLGSWLPPGLLEGMKLEAKSRSQIMVYNQLDSDLESTARELLAEQNQMTNQLDSRQTLDAPKDLGGLIDDLTKTRGEVIKKKVASYKQLFATQQSLIDQAEGGQETMSFTTFASTVESPVDWVKSKIVYTDRAFDSISVNAQFINTNTNVQSASTAAASVQSAVKSSTNSWFGNSWSSTLASSAAGTMTNTAEMHNIESTLLLTSFATHRLVRQFAPLVIDPDILLSGWNYFVPSEAMQLDTITGTDYMKASDPKAPKIYLCDEVFLGSAMIGMVHFLQTSSTMSSQETMATTSQALTSIRESMLMYSQTFSAGEATQFAAKMANLISQSGLQCKFDLVCLGYIPTIKSNNVAVAVKQFSNFDPATFQGNQNTTIAAGLDGVQSTLLQEGQSQNSKQSDMNAVINATIMGLAKTDDKDINVLDFNTFMTAFDDYVKNAPSKEGVGVPVGMNVRMYSKRDIIGELAKKYFDSSAMVNPAAANKPAEGTTP